MKTSQDWWPADFGHYGPFFIRMAWHSAGTYRIYDGRGGAGLRRAALRAAQQLAGQREPRQGAPAAVADQEEVRQEDLVGRPAGLDRQLRPGVDGVQDLRLRRRTRGRLGATEVNWGTEDTWLADARYSGDRELANPLGAVQMGLIYVNPEGPNGNPDPLAAARDIRETFRRMAMNDEETVALIAGGHTFGKTHGAGPATHVGPEPEAPRSRRRASAGRAATAPARAATPSPVASRSPGPRRRQVEQRLLRAPVRLRVGTDEEPGRGEQWKPKGGAGAGTVPDAHDPSKRHAPTMLTTDLSLRARPGLREDLAALPREPARVR